MSLIPLGVTIAQAALLDLINPIFIIARRIATIVPNVTVREIHTDELAVTEHPVEQNAAVADHAYPRPVGVVIEVGFSNSSFIALGNPNYVRDVYGQFVDLKASRVPFSIVTGKRSYRNMVIVRLSTTTDEKTENVLLLTVECREVIIVSTQVVTVPDASVQRSPEVTGKTVDAGTRQTIPQ